MTLGRPHKFLAIILLLGLILRLISIFPNNIILGFDQARDLFAARRIFAEGDLRIVGPTAGNNAFLHHGVAFLYLIIPPIFFGGGNPFWVSLWLSFFNLASAFVLYLFAKSLFKSQKAGLIAAVLASVSFYFIQFAGWISNPSPTLLTVPLAFYGLWEYAAPRTSRRGAKKDWFLPLSLFFLGLSIQFELFFLYLIPVFIILWFIIKLKLPSLKLATYSILLATSSLSTMILTEFKFRFGGVLSLLSGLIGRGGPKPPFSETLKLFLDRYFETFSLTLFPTNKVAGMLVGYLVISYLVFALIKTKRNSRLRFALIFLTSYILSPMSMLALGFHAAPWVLIGLSPAIILVAAFVLSKIKAPLLLYLCLFAFLTSNILHLRSGTRLGQPLLGPDASAIVSSQLAAIDYTYQKATGKPFAVNTVTNPLYINAVWAWQYNWYGAKKYGYLPGWLGGDQEKPYDILRKAEDIPPLFFLIIDETPRIPEIHRILARNWAEERGRLVEEKDFGSIKILAWERKDKN